MKGNIFVYSLELGYVRAFGFLDNLKISTPYKDIFHLGFLWFYESELSVMLQYKVQSSKLYVISVIYPVHAVTQVQKRYWIELFLLGLHIIYNKKIVDKHWILL